MWVDKLFKGHQLSLFGSSAVWVIGGLYALFLHCWLGMDGSWDTANYHLFIGWAALHFSPYAQGAVAQYHTYLNPVIDMLNYAVFSISSYWGAALHGVALAFSVLMLAYLGGRTMRGFETHKTLVVFAVAFGVTGAMTVSLFGTLANEHITALLILIALWTVIKNTDRQCSYPFYIAGFIIGFTVGLKLTAAPYAMGLIACIAICTRLNLKILVITCLLTGVGFLVADGVFLFARWSEVGNPLFPFANNIFKSTFSPIEWKTFSVFEWKHILYYLGLPIVWLGSGDFSEANTVRDGRLLLAYLGFFLMVCARLQNKHLSREQAAVVVFFIVSWLVWILVFRIYRYLVVLEMLSGIVFFIGLTVFFSGDKRNIHRLAIVAASVFLYGVTVYPDWGRRVWQRDFSGSNVVELIGRQPVDVVFMAGQRVSYMAPSLSGAHIPVRNLFAQAWYEGERNSNPTDPETFDISSRSNVYFLQNSPSDPRLQSARLNALFADDVLGCQAITTTMSWTPYLCTFKKVRDLPALEIGKAYAPGDHPLAFAGGWSNQEVGHRWSDGKKSTLYFNLPVHLGECRPVISLQGTTLGEQSVTARFNGTDLITKKLTGNFELHLPVGQAEGNNRSIRLDLLLPDATTPSGGDPRILGVDLHTLRMDCD